MSRVQALTDIGALNLSGPHESTVGYTTFSTSNFFIKNTKEARRYGGEWGRAELIGVIIYEGYTP